MGYLALIKKNSGAIILASLLLVMAVGCGGGGGGGGSKSSSSISSGSSGGSGNVGGGNNNQAPASVALYWDTSITNTETGYKIYYGTNASNYTASVDVGKVNSYTLTLTSGNTYYFAITAYDSSRNESGFSNEISKSL